MTPAEYLRTLDQQATPGSPGPRVVVHDEHGSPVFCDLCGDPATMAVNIDTDKSAVMGGEDRFRWRCPRHGGYVALCSIPEHKKWYVIRTLLPALADYQGASDEMFAQDQEIGLVHASVHNNEVRVDKDTFFALWDAYRRLAAAVAAVEGTT